MYEFVQFEGVCGYGLMGMGDERRGKIGRLI
jgi:hypothetical protein